MIHFFTFRHSKVRSKCKPPKSARLGNNASQQPKIQGPTPAPTPDTEKRGHYAAKHPRPEEEAEASTTTHPTAADPTATFIQMRSSYKTFDTQK